MTEESAKKLFKSLEGKYGVEGIDVVIANAGVGDSFLSVLETGLSNCVEAVLVNTLGPVALYQVCLPNIPPSPLHIPY